METVNSCVAFGLRFTVGDEKYTLPWIYLILNLTQNYFGFDLMIEARAENLVSIHTVMIKPICD